MKQIDGQLIFFDNGDSFGISIKIKKPKNRLSWDDYGITKQRYKELTDMVRSGKYDYIASSVAHTANEMIAEYILLSVMEKRSYEGIEYAEGLGRIPCGRTDFYGYRRYFYHLFDLEVRRIGK